MTRQQDTPSAIVLCGGKSLRAGFDKQTLRLDGKLIAEWIADALSASFQEVILVTNQPQLYRPSRYTVVEDLILDRGPLGGIHAGLMNCAGSYAFVTACDMPNISQAYLRFLKREAAREKNGFDAVAVRQNNGMLETMHAIYSKKTLPQIEEMLQNNERKTANLFLRVRTRYVSESEVMPFGGHEYLFFNMNTPEEIQAYFEPIKSR